jgi:hypothetical protein
LILDANEAHAEMVEFFQCRQQMVSMAVYTRVYPAPDADRVPCRRWLWRAEGLKRAADAELMLLFRWSASG